MKDFLLTTGEVALLEVERFRQGDLNQQRRIEALLLLGQGESAMEAARKLGVPPWQVQAWVRCYREEGLIELMRRDFQTAPCNQEEQTTLLQELEQSQKSLQKNLYDLKALIRQLRDSLPLSAQDSDLAHWLVRLEKTQENLLEAQKAQQAQLASLKSHLSLP